jgi:hypothetical protein
LCDQAQPPSRIGATEGAIHDGPQRNRVDAVVAFEVRQKRASCTNKATGKVD